MMLYILFIQSSKILWVSAEYHVVSAFYYLFVHSFMENGLNENFKLFFLIICLTECTDAMEKYKTVLNINFMVYYYDA